MINKFFLYHKMYDMSQFTGMVSLKRDLRKEPRALVVRNRIDMRSWGHVSVCIEKNADPVTVGLKVKSLIKED